MWKTVIAGSCKWSTIHICLSRYWTVSKEDTSISLVYCWWKCLEPHNFRDALVVKTENVHLQLLFLCIGTWHFVCDRYLESISSQLLPSHRDTVQAMISGAESRIEVQRPPDRYCVDSISNNIRWFKVSYDVAWLWESCFSSHICLCYCCILI